MKNSKIILGCLISIMLATFATAASAAWVPVTNKVPLRSLLDGNQLVFGDKVLSDVTMVGIKVNVGTGPDPDKIYVQGGQDSLTGDYGLRFNLSWNVIKNQTLNATLSFKVSVLPGYDNAFIKDARLDMSGAGATGRGVVSIAENIRNAAGNIIASLSTSKQYNDGGVYLTDSAEFDPVKGIFVDSKDISVTCSGLNIPGAAHLSEFYQYYSQVPEPTTLVLLGLGTLSLFRRRREA